MTLLSTSNWVPESEAEKEAVSRQLEKLFAHPTFKSSRRCPAFLRYIVEHQLRGETQQLKERTIGAEVFGRSVDYDTSSDPVVRTTASEVRKRIAQYYQEPGHEQDLRIELPLGSYFAEFHLPQADVRSSIESPLAAQPQPQKAEGAPNFWAKKRIRIATAIVAALIISAGLFAWWTLYEQPPPIGQFWSPALASHNPVLVCLNTWDISSLLRDSSSPLATGLTQAGIDLRQWLPINDAVAFSQVTGFLGTMRSNYHIQGAKTTTLSDLMQAPSVLIGLFGNPWTQRVTDPLRFHFVRSNPGPAVYIADQKDPSKHYSVEQVGTSTGTRDYAVIGRVFNPATGQVCFIIAGLDAAGTTAASEFITSARHMEYLKTIVPNMLRSKNLEAIISVEVIDGRPGAPHVEAAEIW